MDKPLKPSPRQAVAVFGDVKALGLAYRELTHSGFAVEEMCVMAPGSVVNAGAIPRWSRRREQAESADENAALARELVQELTPSGAYCAAGLVYSSSGALCDVLGADRSGGTRGDWLADRLAAWIARQAAEFLEDRLGEGKVLLWVEIGDRTPSGRESLACTTLLRHASESVRVLDFSRRA